MPRWAGELSAADVQTIIRDYESGGRVAELAHHHGVGKSDIYYHLAKQGVPRRPNGGLVRRTKEAQCPACGITFVARDIPSHRQKFCSRGCAAGRRGADNPNGKAGAVISVGGYRYVRTSDEELRRFGSWKGRIAEHVLIASRTLGRRMRHLEVVHHVNGDKLDNRRQNLVICTQSYHRFLHGRMGQLYQREHFGRVG